MTSPEVPIRLRVHPVTPRKSAPSALRSWPMCTLVFHVSLRPDGALLMGNLLELVQSWSVTEQLVYPGNEPAPELLDYQRDHEAHVVNGVRRRIELVPTELAKLTDRWDGLGYRLRDRGYRRGWTIVCAGAARQLTSVADHWIESRKFPGAWSLVVCGLGRWIDTERGRRFQSFGDAPRIVLTPVGRRVLARWGSTMRADAPEEGTERRLRPLPKRGPIVDVLSAAGALSGAAGERPRRCLSALRCRGRTDPSECDRSAPQ